MHWKGKWLKKYWLIVKLQSGKNSQGSKKNSNVNRTQGKTYNIPRRQFKGLLTKFWDKRVAHLRTIKVIYDVVKRCLKYKMCNCAFCSAETFCSRSNQRAAPVNLRPRRAEAFCAAAATKKDRRRSGRMVLVNRVWRSCCVSSTCGRSTRPFCSAPMASSPTCGRRSRSSPPTWWDRTRTWRRLRWVSPSG